MVRTTRLVFFIQLAVLLPSLWALAGQSLLPENPEASQWQVPSSESLKKNVEFWIKINSQYSISQGLIHDSENLNHVYEEIDFKKSKLSSNQLVSQQKAKWRRVLLSVHRKQAHPETLSADERKVYDLFQDSQEPNKFLNAAHRKRLRFQLGQKERMVSGLYQSGKYLKKMEDVFREAGLPIELTRLPFVESSFNLRARSKVGASGIWQFMKFTARLFLRTDSVVDERNDPIRASEAAAKLLAMNYRSLGNWPLAVTAYNHGRKGLMRAVRRVGSDQWMDIVDSYAGRSFGFASRNFYPELVALVEIEKNPSKYLGPVERAPALSFYEVKLPEDASVGALEKMLSVSSKEIQELNPALLEGVWKGKTLIPRGYVLRIKKTAQEPEEKLARGFLEKFLAQSRESPSFPPEGHAPRGIAATRGKL